MGDLFGSKSPPPPDYTQAAIAQGGANLTAAQQQALLNNPNMVTPYGNQTYTEGAQTGVDANGLPIYGRPTLTQTLSAPNQAVLDESLGLKKGALDLLWQDMPNIGNALSGQFNFGQPITYGGFLPGTGPSAPMQYSPGASGPIQAGIQPGQNFIPSVEAAQYAQGAMFLDPQFKQAQSDLNAQLANQGIAPGSDAWNRAQSNLALQKQSAYQGNINSAITQGQGAAQGIFGMNQAAGQFANAAQAQQYQELLNTMQARNAAIGGQASIASNQTGLANAAQQQGYTQYAANRTMPINMLTALLGTGQIQNPTFQSTTPTAITPPPIFQGANLQGQQNAATGSANAGKFGNLLNAGATVGAAAISDRRLKSDIKLIGKIGPYNWYEYELFGRREQGVMADEVEQITPAAVITGADGYKRVYYNRLEVA